MKVPASVGVLGGGRMGAGIAHVFAFAGAEVTVVERDDDAAKAALERVHRSALQAKNKAREPANLDELLARVEVTTDYAKLGECDLVIEALPENFELKAGALLQAESHLGEHAWLTTNTSSLSVTDLSSELLRPERFCGLHFFNPVPGSLLVEVVLTSGTADQLKTLAVEWVEYLGKQPIVVHDAPGFASSRLGVALALEAMRMLQEGVASAEDIDMAMVLGYRHATGPLKTTDLVGLDVRLGIAEYLEETLGSRFAVPEILREKVSRGELGRKSGKGFFDYS